MDQLSPDDLNAVARTVLGEAGNQGDAGMAAVASVIRNRLISGQYGNSASSIVHSPGEFSAWNLPNSNPNNPRNYSSKNPDLQHAQQIVQKVWSGQIPDSTGGADHYLNPALVNKTPSWANGQPTAEIGAHSFYAPNGPVVPDILGSWNSAPSQQSNAPDLLGSWKTGPDNQPTTFAERAAEPVLQEPSPVGFWGGLKHGLASTAANLLSGAAITGGGETGQPNIDLTPGQAMGVIQNNITGPLAPGTGFTGRLGENIGQTLPYVAMMPTPEGILPRFVQAGLIGAGSTVGEAATKGTPLEPFGGIIGGALAPGAVPAVIGGLARGTGAGLANLVGASSGIGPTPLMKAFQAGTEGGGAAAAFRSGITGQLSPKDIVGQATDALSNMKFQRAQQYQNSLDTLAESKSILNFNDVDAAVDKANSIQKFKGQELSPQTQAVRDEISSAIDNWKNLDPPEYHTPVGFDALKKQIGNIKDNLPYDTPQRKVAEDIYGAVRNTIAKQAPEYDDMMKGYSDASDQIDEIKKTLSLNPKASLDTAFRKLASTMRNNVNTNYGQRANLLAELERKGAPNLSSALAGQSLTALHPRGLATAAAAMDPFALFAAYQGGGLKGLALAASALPLQSPRIMGEAAYRAGQGYGALPNILPSPMFGLGNQGQKLLNTNIPGLLPGP